jgi:hypothetical protein
MTVAANSFLTPETGEQTVGDASGITSTGYETGTESSIDLTPLKEGDALPDKDYSTHTGGLLTAGDAATAPGVSSVSENMENLLDRNSRYMKQAEADANKQMNKRGLLNSSMAVGAAQDARVRSALPIAAQDAQQAHAAEMAAAGARYNLAQGQQAGNIQAYVDQIKGAYALRGQELSDEQALQLAREEMVWKSGLSEQEAQQAMDYMNQEYGNRYDLGEQEFLNRLATDDNLNELQKDYLIADYQQRTGLTTHQTNEQLRLMDHDAWIKENLALMNHEFQVELQNIDGQWKNLFQTNVTASQFYSSIQESITDIMSSPDIPAATKDTYIAQQIDALESGLTVIGAIADFDLGDLLNFGTTNALPA